MTKRRGCAFQTREIVRLGASTTGDWRGPKGPIYSRNPASWSDALRHIPRGCRPYSPCLNRHEKAERRPIPWGSQSCSMPSKSSPSSRARSVGRHTHSTHSSITAAPDPTGRGSPGVAHPCGPWSAAAIETSGLGSAPTSISEAFGHAELSFLRVPSRAPEQSQDQMLISLHNLLQQ